MSCAHTRKSDLAYKQEGEGTSHVYRLILKPDNTARVEIDGENIYEGSLKEDWELLAPKENRNGLGRAGDEERSQTGNQTQA